MEAKTEFISLGMWHINSQVLSYFELNYGLIFSLRLNGGQFGLNDGGQIEVSIGQLFPSILEYKCNLIDFLSNGRHIYTMIIKQK